MKYLTAILFSAFCLLSGFVQQVASAADFVISNNAIITFFGDSYLQSDTASGPVTGWRFTDYLESFYQLNAPVGGDTQGTNTLTANLSEAGANMGIMRTNNIPAWATALWGYQSNSFQQVCFQQPTDNGSYTSNQMFSDMTNIFHAPGWLSDGATAPVTHTGWLASRSNTFQWIGLGDPPIQPTATSDQTLGARNDASTNAGWSFGARGLDMFHARTNQWAQDNINSPGGTNGPNIGVVWLPAPHFIGGGDLDWAIVNLEQMTTDTNINTAVIDWSGTIVSTNHCVASAVTAGSSLTFTLFYYRFPMAWDHAGDVITEGTITNTADGAFNLDPTDGNYFKSIIRIPNIPAGNYRVSIGGTNCATVSGTQLANGWNMFTNTAGPIWKKRVEVLRRIRIKNHLDPITLVQQTPNHQGLWSYMQDAGTAWVANERGEALRTDTTLVSDLDNIVTLNHSIQAAAAPESFTFTISPVGPPAFMPWANQ